MKCPSCNNEVSHTWKRCPYCEYVPRKCSNPDCVSNWLPSLAIYCPNCGKRISDMQTNTKSETKDETIANIIKKKELSSLLYSIMSAAKII